MASVQGFSPAAPQIPPEESANLDTAILVAKVGCVALAALIVVGFVLAVAFSGAWVVVIPAMLLFAVATVAFPFALHILSEASLGQASLVAQQKSSNGNTQGNTQKSRSGMSREQLGEAHEQERRKLISEQIARKIPEEQGKLEFKKLQLKQKRESLDRNYKERRAEIEKEKDPKGKSQVDSGYEELREEGKAHAEKIERLDQKYNARRIENSIEIKNLEFDEKIKSLDGKKRRDRDDFDKLIEVRQAEGPQKDRLYKVFREVYALKEEVLNAERELELHFIQSPDVDSIPLKEALREAEKALAEKEKELKKLKSELPRDPDSFLARAIDFASKHMPSMPSFPSFSSQSSSSSPSLPSSSSSSPSPLPSSPSLSWPLSNQIDEGILASLINSLEDNEKNQVQSLEASAEDEHNKKYSELKDLGASSEDLEQVKHLLDELKKLRVLEWQVYLIEQKGTGDSVIQRQIEQKHSEILQELKETGEKIEELQKKIEERAKISGSSSSSSGESSSSSSSSSVTPSEDEKKLIKKIKARGIDSAKQGELIAALREYEKCRQREREFLDKLPLGSMSKEAREELSELTSNTDAARAKYRKLRDDIFSMKKKVSFFS